jgi:tetratricopeptide (TPR) repeat protein
MKALIFTFICVGGLIALALSVNRPKPLSIAPAETIAESTPPERIEPQTSLLADRSEKPEPESSNGQALPRTERAQPIKAPQAFEAPSPASNTSFLLRQVVETLVSPQTGFEQKQATWKRLRETGQLDAAIGALEQRASSDPQNAACAAALGQAYLKKCAGIADVREQAIFAMKADQTLESALTLDPANWEARYTKAVGMSYWPAQLNKQQEVIEQFRTLIQQQELQTPEPHFARSYAWLGDQYQKAGQPDYAVQVWQRGAALFPDNQELKRKLASAP